MTSFEIETNDPTLHNVSHKITIVIKGINNQCINLEVNVLPAKCELDIIQSHRWLGTDSSHAEINHRIADQSETLTLNTIVHQLDQHCP